MSNEAVMGTQPQETPGPPLVAKQIVLTRIDLTRLETKGDELTPPPMVVAVLIPREPDAREIRILLKAEKAEGVAFSGEIEFALGVERGELPQEKLKDAELDFLSSAGVNVIWAFLFPLLDSVLAQMGFPPLRRYAPDPAQMAAMIRAAPLEEMDSSEASS